MVAFASEFDGAAEVDLPSAVLRKGAWCKGGYETAHYHDGIPEMVAAVGAHREVFENRLISTSSFHSAFDAMAWASSALRLPVLLNAGEPGEAGIVELPGDLLETLQNVSAVRSRIAGWITDRIATGTRVDEDANPGVAREANRLRVVLAAEDLRGLGLSDVLMADVRRLWQHVAGHVLGAPWP
jgi:hypothetical protein